MLDLMQQLLEAAGTADEPRTQGGGNMPILQKTADKRAAELEKAAAVLKEYQEHTAAANALIIEIAIDKRRLRWQTVPLPHTMQKYEGRSQ